jgi:SAM-dependent methyltransferase
MGWLSFWWAYLRGRVPWDTNVTPPELVRTVEGAGALPAGRVLDLGCGTGTNVIYLARRGWEAVGVDFIGQAVRQARHKARAAGVKVTFYRGDVSRLDDIEALDGSFDLVLDIGCLHSLTPAQRAGYAAGLLSRLRPGGTFLLYGWAPRPFDGRETGISQVGLEALFAPDLRVVQVEWGQDAGGPAAWYWLKADLGK